MGLRNSSTAFGEASGVYRAGGGAVEPAARIEPVGSQNGAAVPGAIARVLLGAIRLYQLTLSPLAPSACKFYPTCSHYGADAIRTHGARRGAWLALRRLLRCHPFSPGGFDPVPEFKAEPLVPRSGERP